MDTNANITTDYSNFQKKIIFSKNYVYQTLKKFSINDFCIINPKAKLFDYVIACSDNTIRVVRQGKELYYYTVSGIPIYT